MLALPAFGGDRVSQRRCSSGVEVSDHLGVPIDLAPASRLASA